MDRSLQTFLELSNQVVFIGSFSDVKLQKDELELFEVSGLILNLFVLVLRISYLFVIDTINKDSKVSKVLTKKRLKFGPGY